jgi:hypothetical protein
MKFSIIFLFFITFIACRNAPQQSVATNQQSIIASDSLVANESETTCDTFTFKLNFNDAEERFRTVEFQEGNQTFRIVPDTTGRDFYAYVQKKIGVNCWETIEYSVQCRQNGLLLGRDYNGDGYSDLTNEWKWETYIFIYDPKNQSFHPITLGGSIDSINNKVLASFQSFDKKGNGESTLYKFEDYKLVPIAAIQLSSQPRTDNDDNFDFEVAKMVLFKIEKDNKTLLQTWQPKDFPQFMKNNGAYDYFEDHEFLQDYWQKNWQRFLAS